MYLWVAQFQKTYFRLYHPKYIFELHKFKPKKTILNLNIHLNIQFRNFPITCMNKYIDIFHGM